MKPEIVDLSSGSDIRYSLIRWARDSRPFISVLQLSISGAYRDGSAGAPDAHYITGIISTTAGVWRPSAFLVDFTNLTYEWGDEMDLIFEAIDENRAVAVVGEYCRKAMASLSFGLDIPRCMSEHENYFLTLADARNSLVRREVENWNRYVKEGGNMSDADLITEADLKLDSEQGGADQPATAPESKPEGDSKPQSKSEGRSQ